MRPIRNRAIAAAVSCLVGFAAGALITGNLADVLTVAAALFVLAVWTSAALYVGVLIERRANDLRFDDMLDTALALRTAGDRLRSIHDWDALNNSLNEEREPS